MGKLLSFAIPCYNSAEYMEHCINTVLAGGDEVEVIIVDDGSKDNTKQIVENFIKEKKQWYNYSKRWNRKSRNKI